MDSATPGTGGGHRTVGANGGRTTTRPQTQRTLCNSGSERTMGSRKRKRGLAPRKAPPTVEVTTAPPTEEVADRLAAASCCSMCGKGEPDTLVDLSANAVMKRTLTSYCNMPTQQLEHSLSSVCVQCVYKVNVHKEMTQALKIRLHRLSNGQIMRAQQNQVESANDVQQQPLDERPALSKSPNTTLRNGYALTMTSPSSAENVTSTLLTSEAARTQVTGSDVLRLPTPPLTAEISASTTPDTKDKVDYKEPARNADVSDERERNVTSPAPSYSPLNRRLSSDENFCELLVATALELRNEQHAQNGRLATQSSRQPYVVEVEDVSPVKTTAIASHRDSAPVLTMANGGKQLQMSLLTLPQSAREMHQNELEQQRQQQHKKDDALRQQAVDEEQQPTKLMQPAASLKSNSLSHSHMRSRSRSNSTQSQYGAQHSMLKVIRERSESALITESGGKINNYQRVKRVATQMNCMHCGRMYWRKDYFAKHIRRCQVRQRHAKALSTHSANDVANGATSVASAKALLHNGISAHTRVFRCTDCEVTATNVGELRAHKQLHFRRYCCELCGSEFTTQHEYDFHHIICQAKQVAQEETNEELSAKAAIQIRKSPTRTKAATTVGRRVTRALSRAASNISTSTRKKSSRRSKSLAMDRSVSQYQRSLDPSVCDGGVSDCSDNDNGVTVAGESGSGASESDDGVSVADTMYYKRMRFTGDWVDDHHSNSNSYTSLLTDSFIDYVTEADTQINTYREYDLYLLDRLKAQIHLKVFHCFAPNCNFTTHTLLNIMLHDYVHHFKNSWFYCKKCGGVFTSKVFLDYHLDRQNGGRYICFKCGDFFEFQHQLERHLIRHSKCVNYHCNYCKFEFLTEHELLQHCELEQHQPNDERTLIRIDPEAMIVNTLPAQQQERRVYSAKPLSMQLPRVPSKRPLELPGHKPYRRHIGIIEFGNQKNPNCWGWQ